MASGNVVTLDNLGAGFDIDTVAQKINVADTSNLIDVDQSYVYKADVDPVDIHNNGTVLSITESRADTGWATIVSGAQYTGSPDHVIAGINIQVDENAASNYWALPEIIVLRNGVRIGAASSILMQTNGTYSAQSTLSAHIIDEIPGANPTYTFFLEENDNRTIAAVPQAHSHVSFRAIEKVSVYAPF